MTAPAAGQWIIQLGTAHASAATALRTFPQVEICAADASLWLRGPCDSGPIQRAMWNLPGERFHVTDKAQLVPWNALLPVAAVPAGPWIPIARYFTPILPSGALPGELGDKSSLQLVRVAQERPAALLRLAARAWLDYVDTAPSIRLAPLQFAVSEEGAVLVRGHPLPGLPGVRYTLEVGIALPSGYGFQPAVSAAVVARLLGVLPNDVAIFDPDGAYALLPADAWIPVSRSAVRISLEGVAV